MIEVIERVKMGAVESVLPNLPGGRPWAVTVVRMLIGVRGRGRRVVVMEYLLGEKRYIVLGDSPRGCSVRHRGAHVMRLIN
jgi:hypothetical protein